MWELSLAQDLLPHMAMYALATLLDLALGERVFPRGLHPVVWMGKVIRALVALLRKCLSTQDAGQGDDSRRLLSPRVLELLCGTAMVVLVSGGFAAAAYCLLEGLQGLSGVVYVLVGSLVLKSTFAVSMLGEAARRVHRALDAGRLEDARCELRALVSRDTSGLTPELAAAAAVESVAENASDSFLAPWLAFALFGIPGAVAYRALNTLDSMIGYRGEYEYLGKSSARLDDVVNLVPSRLSAVLIVLGGLVQRFHPPQRGISSSRWDEARAAWRVTRRDHGQTESPNAGWPMSAMAGSLGVQLQKVGHYSLGDPTRSVGPEHIKMAVARMYFVAFSGLILVLAILLVRHGLA